MMRYAGLSLLFFAACGSGSRSDADASTPDAESLTIGEICDLLTPITCMRDAECFNSYPDPCSVSFREDCCEEDNSCPLMNGITVIQVDNCIAALSAATCDEIVDEFPASCRDITRPPDAIDTNPRLRRWSSF